MLRSLVGSEMCIRDRSNFWLYRYMLSPGVKNLAFLGMVDSFRLPLVINLQAIWLCEVLRGQVKLPSHDEMQTDIDIKKRRFKECFPEFKQRAHYWMPPHPLVSILLRDMGLTDQRQTTWKKHWVLALKTEDYKSVVTHRV